MSAPQPASRTICLYNPISRQGHLDSYARLYAQALVELGHRVLLVAETDAGAPAYLARVCPERAACLTFAGFADAEVSPQPRRDHLRPHRRAALVWQEEGWHGIARRLYAVPARMLWSCLPARAQDAVRNFMLRLRRTHGRPPFRLAVRRVAHAADRSGLSPDLIFILYLDLMSEARRDIRELDGPDGRAWSGILFHPRGRAGGGQPDEAYFGAASARGAIFLVPDALPAYARRYTHQHFALAPDVADLELAPRPHKLAKAMRARAGSRTIVLAIGTVAPHKGIDTLLGVIRAADPRRFFFALAGAVHWSSFGAFAPELRAFYDAPPENVLVHDGYVDDEPDYNTLIAASDIVYAVYKGFGSSSNSLTKAAGFDKPILVADGTLMGSRVHEARIGGVAREGDPASILEALQALAVAPPGSFDFATYASRHSLAELKRVLGGAIGQWCPAQGVPAAVAS